VRETTNKRRGETVWVDRFNPGSIPIVTLQYPLNCLWGRSAPEPVDVCLKDGPCPCVQHFTVYRWPSDTYVANEKLKRDIQTRKSRRRSPAKHGKNL